MKVFLKLFLIFNSFVIIGCDTSHKSRKIVISGVVLDSVSNNPIKAARVTVLCWKKVGFDDVNYDKIDTVTDDKGTFWLEFDEGYKLDVAAIGDLYSPVAKEVKSLSHKNSVSLMLVRNNSSPSSIKVEELTLSMRRYNTSDNKLTATVGIDLLSGHNSLNKDSCDIWIELNSSDSSFVLTTLEKGGIQPIFSEISSSAPTNKYIQRYNTHGDEQGFYVRCRDGRSYGKLIVVSSNYDRSSPFEDGFYIDKGIMFRTYLNTEGKEDFNILPPGVSLEQFILENI